MGSDRVRMQGRHRGSTKADGLQTDRISQVRVDTDGTEAGRLMLRVDPGNQEARKENNAEAESESCTNHQIIFRY